MTVENGSATIAGMLRRNRNKQEASAQADMPETAPTATQTGDYVPFELPTYHKGRRRVVVYTSDANGRIIKTFKK